MIKNMKILLSYIFALILVAIIGTAFYLGGFWAASTFFLINLFILVVAILSDYLQFFRPLPEKPHWICGTPQAVQDEVNEHYQKAVDLVNEHNGATFSLLEDNLGIWGNGGIEERILDRMVEEGILTETTIRTWVLKDVKKLS